MTKPPVDARRDLRPDFKHPDTRPDNWLTHRVLNNALVDVSGRHAKGRLLDIGCGLKPYAPLFAPHVSEHVGVDHPESPHATTSVDVLASAYEIPLPDCTFHTVLMTELLEHLEQPSLALAEAHRLLAPGGKIILSTPFVWVIHEAPRDFYRYSPHGLRWLLESAGFVDVEVVPLGGQWTTLGVMFGYAVKNSPMRRFRRSLPLVLSGIQQAAMRLDRRMFDPWFAHAHLVVASKP